MRIPIIAGNWKMNKTVTEGRELAQAMRNDLERIRGIDKVLCPPFISLTAVAEMVRGSSIGVGAQNMFWEEKGAFTGEISPVMLRNLCQYVILGHSERRQYFGETDEGVNRKLKAALAHGLIPIICVGENLVQNEAGETEVFVSGQVRAAFAGLSADQARGCVIAYEPIWAIGTGKAATAAGANAVIGLTIRGTLAELFGEEVAQAIRIQYGGSVTPGNIAEFMTLPDIDGALVGGAALKAADFVAIVQHGKAAKGRREVY
ncbi:MAG: triose-phosphate isomerase [Chloroflexi bacterium RBG_16_57_9]|nr:MAG: triose-phosphate isomerase [Chloroflexi bacterium RBG_16_57_9]